MRRRLALLASATLALLMSLTLSAQAASRPSAAPAYTALGDSYSSGLGARVYYRDGTACYRSPKTYGALLAVDYDLSVTLVACSGAQTADVVRDQLTSLNPSTRYVTMTIGGNDVGFSSALTICALPGWLGNCRHQVDAGLAVLRRDLPDRLDRLLGSIRSRAPRARVVVAGYPHLFNGTDCNAGTFFSRHDEDRINRATDELDALIESRTKAAGFTFVPVVDTFDGHAVCDRAEWINGLSFPVIDSFHPNTAGYRAYARLVGPVLVGRVPQSTAVAAVTAADEQPATTRVRLPRETTTAGGFEFHVPDLTSDRAARAAARAGINPADLRRLQRAQRDGASNATLERINAEIVAAAAHRR